MAAGAVAATLSSAAPSTWRQAAPIGKQNRRKGTAGGNRADDSAKGAFRPYHSVSVPKSVASSALEFDPLGVSRAIMGNCPFRGLSAAQKEPAQSPAAQGSRSESSSTARRVSAQEGFSGAAGPPVLSPPNPSGTDGSGTVVAKILEAGVRLLLRRHQGVQVVVHSSWPELLFGSVKAVHLSGRGWLSKLGLAARELIVSAPTSCKLDYGELLAGRVTLTECALGWAEAAFDASDFANFLVYPPVVSSARRLIGSDFSFEPQGVRIDVAAGQVHFVCRQAGEQFNVVLEAVGGVEGEHVGMPESNPWGVLVVLEPSQPALACVMTKFFNELEVDLAGVGLRFAGLAIREEAGRAIVRLRLNARIQRIPNPLRDTI
ncbi:unnamed protein product [Polarella glacialis]|uniref:Uncharacterized protein n=1 Tax=Polarella glacialis TaxID=89957 RepID=A0A813HM52_POLGL|nr:unnamed protein product [Polarella glacialis]